MTIQKPVAFALNPEDREYRYRISKVLLLGLFRKGLTLHGARVLHGLVHSVCRQTTNWHDGTAPQFPFPYRIRCVELRRNLGLEKANGNAALKAGLQNLEQLSFLEEYTFCHWNQWLEFNLTEKAFALLFDIQPYGLFDIRDAASLSSTLDFLIYETTGIARRKRAPEFDLCADTHFGGAGHVLDWPRLRPKLVPALQKSARIFGMKFVVICEARGSRLGIDEVKIRMSSAGTLWSNKSLSSMPNTARKVILISQDEAPEISPADAPQLIPKFAQHSDKNRATDLRL